MHIRRKNIGSSPRPWGCFYRTIQGYLERWVFPTSVGVFLKEVAVEEFCDCLPHVRGGVSGYQKWLAWSALSSPRPWGCFWRGGPRSSYRVVFPTSVGVFLKGKSKCLNQCRLPHVRGGVSHDCRSVNTRPRSSPRPWGCFFISMIKNRYIKVFPTSVGVFPMVFSSLIHWKSLPHVRGGVSAFTQVHKLMTRSSPRPWGCF